MLALTSPQPFILLAPVQQVTAGFSYGFYHCELSVLKGRRGSSEQLKVIADECCAGDLLCMYGSQCMGCIMTWPRLI